VVAEAHQLGVGSLLGPFAACEDDARRLLPARLLAFSFALWNKMPAFGISKSAESKFCL